MPAIGITGGIGTGKSSFLRALLKQLPADCFDADRCVHELLETPEVRAKIVEAFGPSALGSGGILVREKLRELIFRSEEARVTLEEILHPEVRKQWQPRADAARTGRSMLYLDIPLLYETGAEIHCDRVLVVACSSETQRNRLQLNRGLAPELIERMIGAQLDLVAKVSRAEHVVWNDGLPSALDDQATLFATYLRDFYG